MSEVGFIKLPKPELEQLHKIAEAHGTTVVGMLRRLIKAEQKAGTIDEDLPGFEAKLTEGQDGRPWVQIHVGGHALPAMDGDKADAFAALIHHHATARGRDNGTKMSLVDGTTLAVGRRGRAMVFRVERDGAEIVHSTLTDSMIGDFCSTISGAAIHAQYADA